MQLIQRETTKIRRMASLISFNRFQMLMLMPQTASRRKRDAGMLSRYSEISERKTSTSFDYQKRYLFRFAEGPMCSVSHCLLRFVTCSGSINVNSLTKCMKISICTMHQFQMRLIPNYQCVGIKLENLLARIQKC